MENTFTYKLTEFEGPLDLLLQLIAKNKLNIYDIELTVLIDQYLYQMQLMKENNMDISSEFLEMASRLIYMKTVSLLPKHEEIETLKDELSGELLEYAVTRQMAQKLSLMTDGFNKFERPKEEIQVDLTYTGIHESSVLYNAYISAVGRGMRKLPVKTAPFTKIVAKKIVSVSSKIVFVMRNLWAGKKEKIYSLYSQSKSRSELVAIFLAILELCKSNRVEITGSNEETEIKLIKEKK